MKIKPTTNWKEHDYYLKVPRDDWYKAIADIQSDISFFSCDFFRKQGLKTLQLPLTTTSISSPMGLGSDSTPVEVELFGIKTFLSDSEQFLLEYGCRIFNKGCFCNMPSHRGENPDKTHLSQFYHAEAEIIGSRDEAMDLAEKYIRYLALELLNKHEALILQIAGDTSHIKSLCESKRPLPRISVDEAEKILDRKDIIHHTNPDFRTVTRLGERKLIEKYGGFVWLVDLDHLGAPFYQAFKDKSTKTSMAADLLFGLGEVIGMGERHQTADHLKAALKLHGVSEESYNWYIKMREVYPMRTSGFGLGVERFICWLLKHDDIRDCQIFPRINGEVFIP